jgi:hypothetical protein
VIGVRAERLLATLYNSVIRRQGRIIKLLPWCEKLSRFIALPVQLTFIYIYLDCRFRTGEQLNDKILPPLDVASAKCLSDFSITRAAQACY